MTFYDYEVVAGWDNDPGTNVETWFPHTLRGRRVPRGSVRNRAPSGHEKVDGWREVTLFSEWTLWEYLDAYVDAIFGGWDGDDTVEVTLRTRLPDNTFEYFNAMAYFPNEYLGDYEHHTTQLIFDITLRFLVIAEVA